MEIVNTLEHLTVADFADQSRSNNVVRLSTESTVRDALKVSKESITDQKIINQINKIDEAG